MHDPIYSVRWTLRNKYEYESFSLALLRASRDRCGPCSVSDAIGGLDAVVGLGGPLDADFVGRLVHERLQGIIESDHEVGMMNRRLSPREDRSEGLVSVRENIIKFVSLPSVKDFGDIQVVGILVLFAKILHEGSLEADLFVTVFQVQLFLFPFVSISHHSLLRWQLNVAHNDVTRPKTLLVEHGEGVILILGPDVEKLAITAFEEEAAFVQIRKEQSVP